MNETKKEKYIRIFLIIIFTSVALIGIVWRYEKSTIDEINSPLAVVLHGDKGERDNPYVVLYDIKKGEHVLALYEVELDRSYYFKTIKGFTLSHKIDQLKKDKENGFWVQMKGKWHYFNEKIEEEDRPQSNMTTNGAIPFKEKIKDDQLVVILNDNTKLTIEKKNDEKVKEVHPLTKNGRSWLIVTNLDIKIVTDRSARKY